VPVERGESWTVAVGWAWEIPRHVFSSYSILRQKKIPAEIPWTYVGDIFFHQRSAEINLIGDLYPSLNYN
jgi:hypothetical protein